MSTRSINGTSSCPPGTPALREPRLTRPVLVRPEDSVRLALPDAGYGRVECLLQPGGMPVEFLETPDGCALQMPADIEDGLYDVELVESGGRRRLEPHCVWVRAEQPESFRCVHVTDLHLLSRKGKPSRDRSPAIEHLLERIVTDLRPDFVINTGDLISRYVRDGETCTPEEAEWQIRRGRELLLSHHVPHFFTPGNHDLAFGFLRRLWERHMEIRPEPGTEDFWFDFGTSRFVFVDRSVDYDRPEAIRIRKLSAARLERLAVVIEGAPDPDRVFLVTHYDYDGALVPLLSRLPVCRVLHGHARTTWMPEALSQMDAHLPEPRLCQVVDVTPQGVQVEPGPALEDLEE